MRGKKNKKRFHTKIVLAEFSVNPIPQKIDTFRSKINLTTPRNHYHFPLV